MSEVWAQWEGQVVNGEFPLRRLLGVSDHSGVFLTRAPALNLADAALKLVPLIPTLAESQLAHWNAAAALTHPHLVRLFATGRCQLGALHCLYVLMEYAEQNLAHLLRNRALSDIEARDLLPPALDALAFLHSHDRVQGQLRPSNILVVGDQLKLASDTIRPAGEAATSISMVSLYDPPEGRDGSFSIAGDIWALGVTLYEALTQSTPEKPDERGHGVVLPADFPPGSADVIRECLSRRPSDRPSVSDLQAWAGARPRQEKEPPAVREAGVETHYEPAARAATQIPQPSALDPILEPVATATGPASVPSPARPGGAAPGTGQAAISPAGALPAATGLGQQGSARGPAVLTASSEPLGRLTIRAVVEREPPQQPPVQKRSFAPVVVGAVAVMVIGWLGVRHFSGSADSSQPRSDTTQTSSAADNVSVDSAGSTRDSASRNAAPSVASGTSTPAASSKRQGSQRSARASNNLEAAESAGLDAATVVHEEMPKVSRNALATVHGRLKVTVRVTVDQSGNVVGDAFENPGPSRYFARAASEAARKWRFATAAGNTSRTGLLRFEFSRGEAIGHLVTKS